MEKMIQRADGTVRLRMKGSKDRFLLIDFSVCGTVVELRQGYRVAATVERSALLGFFTDPPEVVEVNGEGVRFFHRTVLRQDGEVFSDPLAFTLADVGERILDGAECEAIHNAVRY